MSNIGFGQDRPYGAFDEDDDFIEEWSASWEPAVHASVDDVAEPSVEAPMQPEPFVQVPDEAFQPRVPEVAPDVEHVYEEALYAPAPEPEAVGPAAEVPAPVLANPYDIESIHAAVAGDTTLDALSAAVVSEHALTPVPAPEPVSESHADAPVAPDTFAEPEEPAFTEPEPAVVAPEPEPGAEPIVEPEAVTETAHALEFEVGQPQVAEPGAVAQPDVAQAEVPAEPESDEPGPERLVAPDDVNDLDLVDWEPQPVVASTADAADGVTPETSSAESEPSPSPFAPPEVVTESHGEAAAEPDHSVGLTGAAAAALAAAAAWGVWSGTPVVASIPAENPVELGEPEPEAALPAEPEPVVSTPFEPEPVEGIDRPAAEVQPEGDSFEPAGLPVPEPEALTIPEPEASGVAPEAAPVPSGLETTPIPEPDMYAVPGPSTLSAPEPEAYVIPEPVPASESGSLPLPTGETTPIPEPGFAPSETIAEAPETPETPEPTDEVAPVDVAPENAAHEQVHSAASQNPAYDLAVDVSSIVGVALQFAPAESAGVAPQAEEAPHQVVVNDEVAAAMFARSEPVEEVPSAPVEPQWASPAQSEWAPPAEPDPVPVTPPTEPEPWARAGVSEPGTFVAPSDPEPYVPQPEPERFAPPADAEPYTPPLDPFAPYTVPPIPDSIFAPQANEGPIPSWTAPEPGVPETGAPAADASPAPAADVTAAPEADIPSAPQVEPALEPAPDQAQAPHESEHSQWFERAKMWAANNLYDPDEDSVIKQPDEGDEDQSR